MRKLRPTFVILIVMVLSTTAVASPDDSVGQAPKSKRTARMLSLGSTMLPMALGIGLVDSDSEPASDLGALLFWGGAIVGPGVGQAYAGRPVRFAAGAIVRTLCLGLAATGLIVSTLATDSPDRPNALFFLGLGGYTFSTVYDIATVDRSIDTYNREHTAREFSIGTAYYPQDKKLGMAFTLRF